MWKDMLYMLCLYPVVQILGTIRHELSHAAAAKLAGYKILELRVFPGFNNKEFYWGYCRYDKPTTSTISLAPYWVAAVNCVLGVPLAIYTYETLPFFWWALLTVVMVVSPLFDILYNFFKWKLDNRGDFAKAQQLKRWEK